MARIIYTCPKCGTDLIDTTLCSYPQKSQKWCPSCGWTHTEDHEEVVRIPFGGNIGWLPFSNQNGICFCTLDGPDIT